MNKYNTDIVKLTCSCPDWKETRSQYPSSDPRRLCKHIIHNLDTGNLPGSIAKFKESIEFYQKQEWGFKRNFDEIIELDNFTLLGSVDWIDVFDNEGARYAVKKESFSKTFYWANERKPKNYELIEQFLIEEAEKIPLPLEDDEYPQIISFIKKVLPQKKDFYITISLSSFIPTANGIIYDIFESRLTPEQEMSLKQELLQSYDKKEAYYKLGKACFAPIDEEHEFDIYEALTVTNNEIIVRMYSGEKYTFKRDYNYVKRLKRARELQKKLEIEERKKVWRDALEQERKIAMEKGYLLSEDYKGEKYNIQSKYNYPDTLSWEEYESLKNSVLGNYDTLQNLIKKNSLNISTTKFNKVLKNLNFITKEPSLNQSNWIIIGDGLNYGINLIKMSKYMHKDIPDWYKVQIFDNKKMKLVNLKWKTNVKMTSALFEKNKFDELCQLVKQQIEKEHNKAINKNEPQEVLDNEEKNILRKFFKFLHSMYS
ncbi:hypothetical protein [Hydrogenimonas sp.]